MSSNPSDLYNPWKPDDFPLPQRIIAAPDAVQRSARFLPVEGTPPIGSGVPLG